MAFNELIVHRALQPWRSAGLIRWLCEDETHAQDVRDSKKQTAGDSKLVPSGLAARTQGAASPAGASATTFAKTLVPVKPPAKEAATQPQRRPESASQTTRPKTEGALQTARPVSSHLLEADTACAASIRHVDQWPGDWRDLLNRSPQPVAGRRARVVWSYAALGDDYGGRANAARRAMLQQLLRDLALPPGSHAFWPLTPPPYSSPSGDPDPVFFHSGIAALNPSVVVLFGEVSPLLRLPSLLQLVPEMVLGRSFVRVQSTEALSAPFASSTVGGRLPHEALVQFLRSQFGALFIS